MESLRLQLQNQLEQTSELHASQLQEKEDYLRNELSAMKSAVGSAESRTHLTAQSASEEVEAARAMAAAERAQRERAEAEAQALRKELGQLKSEVQLLYSQRKQTPPASRSVERRARSPQREPAETQRGASPRLRRAGSNSGRNRRGSPSASRRNGRQQRFDGLATHKAKRALEREERHEKGLEYLRQGIEAAGSPKSGFAEEPELELGLDSDPESESEPDLELELEPAAAEALRTRTSMTMYLPSGKRKHDRFFWVEDGSTELNWAKSKDGKAGKRERLVSVVPGPKIKDAQTWFEETDADGSGFLDGKEVAALYKRARGQKLSRSEVKAAMLEMDGDGNGEVCLAEFQQWWAANGGDLEQHREKALTFVCEGGLEVLVVAPNVETKMAWVRGVEEVLREGKPRAVSFDVSAEAPSRESPQRPPEIPLPN